MMIDPTAERWNDSELVCTVERNGLRAPKTARYKWTVMLPEDDDTVWPPGPRLVAHGTAADADGARQDCQNAAQDWLRLQPATSPECPHDAQESRGDVFATEGQVYS